MARKRQVSIDEFENILAGMLKEYTEDVSDAIEKEVIGTAKKVQKETKRLSPRRRPQYYKGWGTTKADEQGKTKRIIWNKKYYNLVHLAEFGHKKFTGTTKISTGRRAGVKMTFSKGGKVVGRPHVRPAYQKHGAALPDHIKKIIKKGGA
jgi:hypothetical protein